MKQNKMNIKQQRTIQEWEELVERYFDALTTDAEEQELKSFLLSSEAAGKVFDEAKAVMGFLKVGQSLHQKKSSSTQSLTLCSSTLPTSQILGGLPLNTSSTKGFFVMTESSTLSTVTKSLSPLPLATKPAPRKWATQWVSSYQRATWQ